MRSAVKRPERATPATTARLSVEPVAVAGVDEGKPATFGSRGDFPKIVAASASAELVWTRETCFE
jgi:hypothetical protein